MIYSGATLKHVSTLCASSAKRERKNKRKKERKKRDTERKTEWSSNTRSHRATRLDTLCLFHRQLKLRQKKKDNKKSKIQNKLTNNTLLILIFDTILSYVWHVSFRCRKILMNVRSMLIQMCDGTHFRCVTTLMSGMWLYSSQMSDSSLTLDVWQYSFQMCDNTHARV